jgi:hypothetical protein
MEVLQQTATVTDVDQVKVLVEQTAANVEQTATKVEQTAANVDQVKRLSSNFISAHYYRSSRILSGNQLRETIHRWLSPPDPSTNHNIACDTHHKKTASWFFQGTIFQEWKSTGSLLWVHGKRLHPSLSTLTPSNTFLFYSWLGQEHPLVRGFSIIINYSGQR